MRISARALDAQRPAAIHAQGVGAGGQLGGGRAQQRQTPLELLEDRRQHVGLVVHLPGQVMERAHPGLNLRGGIPGGIVGVHPNADDRLPLGEHLDQHTGDLSPARQHVVGPAEAGRFRAQQRREGIGYGDAGRQRQHGRRGALEDR